MANFKRKKYLSGTSRRCTLCGSQRRLGNKFVKNERKRELPKLEMKEFVNEIGFPQI